MKIKISSPYPIAYRMPYTPPNPPVLPSVLSMTYPTVSCVHSPLSLKHMEHDCGGDSTFLFVALRVPIYELSNVVTLFACTMEIKMNSHLR